MHDYIPRQYTKSNAGCIFVWLYLRRVFLLLAISTGLKNCIVSSQELMMYNRVPYEKLGECYLYVVIFIGGNGL